MKTDRRQIPGAFFALALAALLGSSPAIAAELVIEQVQAGAGGSVWSRVMLNSDGAAVAGLSFDLDYDPAVMRLYAVSDVGARTALKNGYLREIAPGRLRFVIAGLNTTAIPDGPVIRLLVVVNITASTGVHAIGLSNLVATNPSGWQEPLLGVAGELRVEVDAPVFSLSAGGVLNAASLLPGPVSPGMLITLLGSEIGPEGEHVPDGSPSSDSLAGTRVLFDGIEAPLLYASSDQINLVAPFEIDGRKETSVQVLRGDSVAASLVIPVAPTAPAIFTALGSGVGQASALNEDGSVNAASNPADRGSILVFFATGGGRTNPVSVDADIATAPLPRPIEPVGVKIGGTDAEVVYAGAAPGLVAGVIQVNCRVPVSVEPGAAVPVELKIGESRSPSGVTAAIR